MAKPAYRAYTVIKRDGKEDFWLNLGVAFEHVAEAQPTLVICRGRGRPCATRRAGYPQYAVDVLAMPRPR